eukprot:1044036-Rhodomonas_salina.2
MHPRSRLRSASKFMLVGTLKSTLAAAQAMSTPDIASQKLKLMAIVGMLPELAHRRREHDRHDDGRGRANHKRWGDIAPLNDLLQVRVHHVRRKLEPVPTTGSRDQSVCECRDT